MAAMKVNNKGVRKKQMHRQEKVKEQAVLSIVSVRISDEEKERIDDIMRHCNIKRYSDVMRMAIQLIRVPNNDDLPCAGTYH